MKYLFFITLIYICLLLPSKTFSEEPLKPTTSKDSTVLRDSASTMDTILLVEDTSDSTKQDSLKSVARRAKLDTSNYKNTTRYQQYPNSLDSIFCLTQVYPYYIFQSEASNSAEILKFNPQFVYTPLSLATSMNKILFMGFPAIPVSLYGNTTNTIPLLSPLSPQSIYSVAEIKNLYITPEGSIRFAKQPHNLSRAETLVNWEMGPFDEQVVNVRFARPITHSVTLGFFSNFQYMNGYEYSHNKGDIYPFYRDIYKSFKADTLLVANTWRNPLSREFTTSASLDWKIPNGSSAQFDYKYGEYKNDIVKSMSVPDTQTVTKMINDTLKTVLDTTTKEILHWDRRDKYSHYMNLHLRDFTFIPRTTVNGEIHFHSGDYRLTPQSFRILDSLSPHFGSIALPSPQQGERVTILGALRSTTPLRKNDTLQGELVSHRDATTLFGGKRTVVHYNKSSVNYKRQHNLFGFKGFFDIYGAFPITHINKHTEFTPTGGVSVAYKRKRFWGNAFIKYDMIDPIVPFDSSRFSIDYKNFTKKYAFAGTHNTFMFKHWGISLGAHAYYSLDKESITNVLWPDGIPPYAQPNISLTIAPFGKYKKFALLSRTTLSDKKPYIKANTLLRYHHNNPMSTLHLMMDVNYRYWSSREIFSYGGASLWHYPIHNLNLKSTIQIKAFRLFFQIDNMLNRKYSYIPGYIMPGLTFRYGLNWQIQG